MALSKLHFTKNWTNKEDFPTHESNEAQVRADIQLLFDEVQMAFNALIDALDAEEIPFDASGTGVVGDNVREAIIDVQEQVASAAAGLIPDKSITQEKLADVDSTGGAAVGTNQLQPGAVTNGKLAPESVTFSKLGQRSVGTSTLMDGAVTDDKLYGNTPTNKADLSGGILAQTQFRLRPKTISLAGNRSLTASDMASIIRVLVLSTNDKTYVVAPVGSSILNGSFVFITSERDDGNTVVRVQSSSNGAVTTTDYPLNKGETAILIKVLDTKWVFSRLG